MKLLRLFVLLPLFSTPAAAVDDAWRDALIGYYRVDVALDACSGVAPSGEDVNLLETAIAEAERRSGLSEDALDELYATIEFEADVDSSAFCTQSAVALTKVRAISHIR